MKTQKSDTSAAVEPLHPGRRHTASALYFITGLGALTTAVGMMLCGKRSRALLVAQWVAPLLITAVNERLACRNRSCNNQ